MANKVITINGTFSPRKVNESLTEEQTKEALQKIEELKLIYESKDSKKTKWDKVKSIMVI